MGSTSFRPGTSTSVVRFVALTFLARGAGVSPRTRTSLRPTTRRLTHSTELVDVPVAIQEVRPERLLAFWSITFAANAAETRIRPGLLSIASGVANVPAYSAVSVVRFRVKAELPEGSDRDIESSRRDIHRYPCGVEA